MNQDAVKANVTRLAVGVLGFLAGRYHLSGDEILAYSADIGTIVAFLYGVYSHWNMVKVPADGSGAPVTGKILPILFAVMILPLFMPPPAKAATTNNVTLNFFQRWADDDIQAAIKLANDFADPDAAACWGAFSDIGKVVKAHPLPISLRLASDIQAIRIFTRTLKKTCMLKECTQMFQEISNQVNAFSLVPLPVSLANICAKIP